MNSENPVKSERSLSDFVFTSRTAVYAIRMYGAVGGALSNGRPYPYGYVVYSHCIIQFLFKFLVHLLNGKINISPVGYLLIFQEGNQIV